MEKLRNYNSQNNLEKRNVERFIQSDLRLTKKPQ